MQLPSRTTTKLWLINFSIRVRLQPLLIDVVLSKHPEKEARETFIAFDEIDEMAVKERWDYGPSSLSMDGSMTRSSEFKYTCISELSRLCFISHVYLFVLFSLIYNLH